MMVRNILRFSLIFSLLFVGSCTTDDGTAVMDDDGGFFDGNDDDGQGDDGDGGIVSGNPELNTLLVTRLDESIMTVNPENGQEDVIYTFSDFIYPEGIPDYENGTLFWTTDDNAINSIDIASKTFNWDTPMLAYKFSSLGVSSVVCMNGVCYAVGGFGVVVAVDQKSGELLWYYSTDPQGEVDNVLNDAGTPIVHGNKVYIFSEEGFISDLPAFIHVLDRATGQLLNKITLPFDISGTPVVSGNVLYVPAGNLYALDVETLQVLWTFEANGVAGPVVSGSRVVVSGIPLGQTIYSALYCLDANSGAILWEKDTGFDTLWSPIVVDEVVFSQYEEASQFAFATSGRPFAARLSDGKQLWFRDDVVADHSLVYANGRLYFHGHDILRTDDTDQNVGLICMDANTGEVLWLNNRFGSGYITAPLVVAQNGVFGPSYYRGDPQ